jgi:hypothetical protein
MVRTSGVSEAESGLRRRICPFYDERLTPARKLGMIHAMMKRDMGEALGFFERIERLEDSLGDAQRQDPAYAQALAEISADDASRDRYLAMARAEAPARRARMVALAGDLGWLSPEARRSELAALATDVLARPTLGYADVDLVCSLNGDRTLDGLVKVAHGARATHAAAMACLGDSAAHGQALRALASTDERDVQAVQAYLRHRPIEDSRELREVAREVAEMPPSAAKVRAIDALGRLNINDGETLGVLVRSFQEATSASIQRAIAEVFLRSDTKAIAKADVVSVLQKHRLKPRDELVDTAIRKLQAS